MKEEIKIPDEVVMPVMNKYSIDREEAEKRLNLLYKSNVLHAGEWNDPGQQELITNFLSTNSEELEELVAFDICLNTCIENKEFVSQYDRLRGRSLGHILSQVEKGMPPKNTEREIRRFGEFVREFVFERLVDNEPTKP